MGERELIDHNSIKGNQKLAYKGFVDTKDKDRGQTCYWKCERRMDGCYGRLTVNDGTVSKEKDHNHAQDTSVPKIQMTISEMKDTISNGRECTSLSY